MATAILIQQWQLSSGNINTVPRNINPHAQWLSHYIRPVAVSIHTPIGNVNTVPEIINSYFQWLSQYTRPVAILT